MGRRLEKAGHASFPVEKIIIQKIRRAKMGKKFWQSKTFWVNVLSIIAILVQTQTGFVIDAEKQVVLLGAVNTLLRFITKEPIEWS